MGTEIPKKRRVMAAKKSQMIGIWVITIMMVLGTVGGFIAMIVAPGNEQKDAAERDKASADYQVAMEEYRKKIDAQAAELSGKYFASFNQYSSRVSTFNKDEVKDLKTEDLLVGGGAEIKDDTKFSAYYIGWNPNGKIFDQSVDGQKLKTPINIDGPKDAAVIEGWKKGLVGMKIGGVRELTIPSAQAYGESGQGEDIPANTPLKFIVMAVEQPVRIEEPQIPQVLKDYYRRAYGIEY